MTRDSVVCNIDYLLVGKKPGKAKLNKAKLYNIPIIKESNLNALAVINKGYLLEKCKNSIEKRDDITVDMNLFWNS